MSKVENKRANKVSTTKNALKSDVKAKPRKTNNEQEIDPDDPCLNRGKDDAKANEPLIIKATVGQDPRFQQQNQTLRCFVSYVDFFRCEKILGEGHEACEWFKDSYTAFCPLSWIEEFDDARNEGRFPWHRRDQGKFPGDKYG